ncbi:MAG TPA: hypothetical protein DCX06_08730 [Opitutae bacterium]|nr:hypothetical protein [Opitutae bacterium]
MSNTNRIIIYICGFIIGMMLVSMLMNRRAAKEESRPDPWLVHNQAMIEAGAKPLPEQVVESMRVGVVIDFGYLPSEASPKEMVWLLKFEDSYPYVRVVQDLQTKELSYMAADQIAIHLREGVDATELKPMLDELGLRLRMFNRKEQLVIIGVLSTEIDAIPATIQAIQPWAKLFSTVEPDFLRFQPKKPDNLR